MSIKQFVLTNILFLYTIGFFGCLLLRKRHRMSLFAFSLLYLLFNYNGHIICHIAAGNYNWIGYFLLPFALLYLLDLCGPAPTYRTAAKLALVLFFISLEGSFHLVTMFMIFFGFLMIFDFRNIKRLGMAAVLAGILCLYRILPAMTSLKEEMPVPVSGFNLTNIFSNLALGQPPAYLPWDGIIVGSWEFDHYITIPGLLVLLLVGVYACLTPEVNKSGSRYAALMYAASAMTIMSLFDTWAFFRLLAPFKVGERIPSRFLIIPLLVVITVACVRLSALRRRLFAKQWAAALWITGLLALAVLLFMHSAEWAPRNLLKSGAYTDATLVKGDNILDIHEPHYKMIVIIATIVSAGALAGTFAFLFSAGSWRGRGKNVWVGAMALWAAFAGILTLWAGKEPHQADNALQTISGYPAYVYEGMLQGYPGPILKVIFKTPMTLSALGLHGTADYPDSGYSAIMEYGAPEGYLTGQLPASGPPKIMQFQPPIKVSYLTFRSQTGGEPTHILKSLEIVDAKPTSN